jgi:hypothetical protein
MQRSKNKPPEKIIKCAKIITALEDNDSYRKKCW